MPDRIQLSRAKGWRMPPNTVKVDRTTRWGNPFHTHRDGAPMEPHVAVDLFTRLLRSHEGFVAVIRGQGSIVTTVDNIRQDLAGKNLACWCAPGQPCHADVLLRIAAGGQP
jgi:hypothetical protein